MSSVAVSVAPSLHRPFPGRALVLGPMAGITDVVFRRLCLSMGADFAYTEMVSAKGLACHPDARAARALLTFSDEDPPCGVQLFGSEPDVMAEQARYVTDHFAPHVSLIDLNMGCPVPKVAGKGEGSALMKDVVRAARIVHAVKRAVTVPVSVKFRKGWDETSVNAVQFARAMEQAGADALTVHGRTRDQFYSGAADWDTIAQVKDAVRVPVTGSGDVFSAHDALAMLEHTDVDAVMIARGALGNPWVFAQARALIDRGEIVAAPSASDRVRQAREHVALAVRAGTDRAVIHMRKHVAWYVSGMPDATAVRSRVNSCTAHAEVDALLGGYEEFLRMRESSNEVSDVRFEVSAP